MTSLFSRLILFSMAKIDHLSAKWAGRCWAVLKELPLQADPKINSCLLNPWDFQELQSAFQRTFALFFPGGSVSKESTSNAGDHLQCRRPGFDPWLRKIPWRRKWQPTPVFLPGKSHEQRGLVGYSPWGRRSWTQFSD